MSKGDEPSTTRDGTRLGDTVLLSFRWLCLFMQRLSLLIGVLIVLVIPASAQPDSLRHRFEAATEAYGQGQYTRAVKGYRAIQDAGYTSGALYYNLGNAYVRLGQLGQAIRYYEKARRLRPRDPKIGHNLEQARRQAGVYPERLGEGPPRGLADLVRDWSPWTLFLVGGVLFGVGGIGAAVWTSSDRRGILRYPLEWGLVAAGLLFVMGAMGVSYVQSLDRRAVIVAKEAPLRSSPAAEAAPDTTLPEGALLEVHTRQGQWQEVRLADETIGWVPVEALGEV